MGHTKEALVEANDAIAQHVLGLLVEEMPGFHPIRKCAQNQRLKEFPSSRKGNGRIMQEELTMA